MTDDGWQRVIFAHDCDECDLCGEPLCPSCVRMHPAATGHNGRGAHVAVERIHYADCSCPGPHQEDEFEYREIDGVLCARRRTETPH